MNFFPLFRRPSSGIVIHRSLREYFASVVRFQEFQKPQISFLQLIQHCIFAEISAPAQRTSRLHQPFHLPKHVGARKVSNRVRQGPNPTFIVFAKRPSFKAIYPLSDFENNTVVIAFAIHQGDDITETAESATGVTIPRFDFMELLIHGKRAPSRKRKHPIMQ